jgi:hypothetical protein
MSMLLEATPRKPSPASVDPWAWREARATLPALAASRRNLRGRLGVAAALVVALGAGAYAAHAQSARIAPWVRPILRSVGYPWREANLRVETVSSRLVAEGRASALIVEGALVNVSNREIDAPALRLAVRSADGAEIFTWRAHAAKTHLGAGERSRFSSRLEAPPSAGVDVAVALEAKGE